MDCGMGCLTFDTIAPGQVERVSDVSDAFFHMTKFIDSGKRFVGFVYTFKQRLDTADFI